MVRIKPANATTNGRCQSCWSLILTCMSAPQTAGQTEVKRQREEGCLPPPTLNRLTERVTERRQMVGCLTHTC